MLKLKEDVEPLVRVSLKLIILPAFTLGIICLFQGKELMALMYDHHAEEAATILATLMFSLIPMAGVYVVGTLLTASGSLKQLNNIALNTVIISIASNFILIPKYGAYGAAITCLTTQGIGFLLQLDASRRLFNLRLTNSLLLLIASSAIVGSAAYLFRNQSWFIGTMLTLLLGGLLTVGISISELKTLKDSVR
jgi:O-antigen/teichoic acid export membrane protein